MARAVIPILSEAKGRDLGVMGASMLVSRAPSRPVSSLTLGMTQRACYKTPMARARGNEFEKAFQQLEEIVKRLESEELPLDESLGLFEQGIALSRLCHQRLAEVEKKIEMILADAKGQPRTEPFEEPEEDALEEPGDVES